MPSPTVTTVTVTPASPSIMVGITQAFSLIAKDASSNPVSGATFTWTSSDTSVATINTNGIATGLKAGSSAITASSGTVTGTATLTVTAGAPAQAPTITSFTATPVNLPVGGGSINLAWKVIGASSLTLEIDAPEDVTGLTQKTVTFVASVPIKLTDPNETPVVREHE